MWAAALAGKWTSLQDLIGPADVPYRHSTGEVFLSPSPALESGRPDSWRYPPLRWITVCTSESKRVAKCRKGTRILNCCDSRHSTEPRPCAPNGLQVVGVSQLRNVPVHPCSAASWAFAMPVLPTARERLSYTRRARTRPRRWRPAHIARKVHAEVDAAERHQDDAGERQRDDGDALPPGPRSRQQVKSEKSQKRVAAAVCPLGKVHDCSECTWSLTKPLTLTYPTPIADKCSAGRRRRLTAAKS